MCVALLKLPKARVSDDIILNCWESNPDGGGFSFSNDDGMTTVKGLMDLEEFKESYRKEEEKNPDRAAMLHFRIATSGGVNKINTHPFDVSGGVMCHNGVMNEFDPSCYQQPERKQLSDTANFVKDFGEDFSADVVKKIRKTLEYEIGSNNKLVFLYPKGEFTIVNENVGDWIKGVWFSNLYWKPR